MGTEGSEVCTSIERNLMSVGALKTLGYGVSVRDGVFKTRGSMVVLKGRPTQ